MPATITRKQLIIAARAEIPRWSKALPAGLVMAVLWAFSHYAFTGDTVEETFFNDQPAEPEYYI